MRSKHLKPAVGLQVRDPATRQPLPVDGADLPMTGYWLRRLADDDVTEAPRAVSKRTRNNASEE